MNRLPWVVAMAGGWLLAGGALAHAPAPVSIEIVDANGQVFREFPVNARDGALRSYLQAEKGARYQVRVRNTTGERLGLVIAVDGRNIINGATSELARSEPMYVLDAWGTQDYAGWRANLQAINEFYFTEWSDSYAEAFGDRSARGVIAVAVFREAPPPRPAYEPSLKRPDNRSADSEAGAYPAPPPASAEQRSAGKAEDGRHRDESAGTGYGERRIDRAVRVEFTAQSNPDSRHFIKYEWRETLCRKRLLECGENNRFWDESTLGFAPPPPRRR
ncbi:MAG TPA: hypothetical protein VFO82_11670 [Steroidobacteraceae bacterium]|nr:hypothetical protein [Steroidobacteraceae bacterium]